MRGKKNKSTQREQLGETAGGVRTASGIEVDNVYEGAGTCQVGPAWFCLLQPDYLTPVKPGLFRWQSPALFPDRRSGVLAHLACCAQPWFCLCPLSLSWWSRPRCPWCLYFSVPADQIALCVWRARSQGLWQPGNCKTLCPKGKSGSEVQTWACQGWWMHSPPWPHPATSHFSLHVFLVRLQRTRPVRAAECHIPPYHKTTSRCMCFTYFWQWDTWHS